MTWSPLHGRATSPKRDPVFTEASDPREGLAVWIFSGPTNTDGDYEASIGCIRRLDAMIALQNLERPAALQIVDDGNPVPGPRWRRDLVTTHLEPTRVILARDPTGEP